MHTSTTLICIIHVHMRNIDSYPSATPPRDESSLTVSLLALKSRRGIPNDCQRQSDQSQDGGIRDHQPTKETEGDLLHHTAGHFFPTKGCETNMACAERGGVSIKS